MSVCVLPTDLNSEQIDVIPLTKEESVEDNLAVRLSSIFLSSFKPSVSDEDQEGLFLSELISNGVIKPHKRQTEIINCAKGSNLQYDNELLQKLIDYIRDNKLITSKLYNQSLMFGLLEKFYVMCGAVSGLINNSSIYRYSITRRKIFDNNTSQDSNIDTLNIVDEVMNYYSYFIQTKKVTIDLEGCKEHIPYIVIMNYLRTKHTRIVYLYFHFIMYGYYPNTYFTLENEREVVKCDNLNYVSFGVLSDYIKAYEYVLSLNKKDRTIIKEYI